MFLEFSGLNPKIISERASEILSVAVDQADEYWELENFLRELPLKWELSISFFSDDRLVGYIICSKKGDDVVHIHHFMLSNDFRGKGIGSKMLRRLESRARVLGMRTASLKVSENNQRARKFYTSKGYLENGGQRGYIEMKKDLGPAGMAVHQPNYLPWLGYFYKMHLADVFVFLDDAQFTKGGYINRVKVMSSKGPRWLTVPVNVSLGQSIAEVAPSNKNWRSSHIDLLRNEYKDTPHSAEILPEIAEVLNRAPDGTLAEVNIFVLRSLAERLNIHPEFRRSTEMDAPGSGDDRLVNLVKNISGNAVYLSGKGGAKYQDPAKFEAAGLGFEYVNFDHPAYDQGGQEFIPGLSVVDCLLRHGWERTAGLIKGNAG